jgi:hypothetical protein
MPVLITIKEAANVENEFEIAGNDISSQYLESPFRSAAVLTKKRTSPIEAFVDFNPIRGFSTDQTHQQSSPRG